MKEPLKVGDKIRFAGPIWRMKGDTFAGYYHKSEVWEILEIKPHSHANGTIHKGHQLRICYTSRGVSGGTNKMVGYISAAQVTHRLKPKVEDPRTEVFVNKYRVRMHMEDSKTQINLYKSVPGAQCEEKISFRSVMKLVELKFEEQIISIPRLVKAWNNMQKSIDLHRVRNSTDSEIFVEFCKQAGIRVGK
jgi:hypothetical protein